MNKFSLPAVYYRMPHEKDVWFIQPEDGALEIDTLNDIPEKEGFIFYPFISLSSSKPLFLPTDKQLKMNVDEIHNANQSWDLRDLSKSNIRYKTKEEYCKNAADAVKAIQHGELEKVVLSRIKKIESNTRNPLKIFHKLCVKYPAAFVSLVYIPRSVLWITATPELLISAKQSEIKTVSLAGTKPLESTAEWGKKEKIEQQIVTDYINEILKKYCGNITISEPQETIAGNVKHLKTSFSAKLNTNLGELVSSLHPTPAVCGIPLEKAKQFINATEGYDRKYYTGFLGPYNMNGRTDLFVNLRCAEVFTDSVNLYIGGGITKDSIPEKEWEETELKSSTLLFAFEENEKE